MLRRSVLLLALSIPSSLLSAPPSSLGDTASDKPQGPVFSTEVSVVSLPVFVVDRQGHALRGLRPEDFELFDDGKKMPIVSFQYVDTTSPEAQDEIRQAPPARRRFFFLFDLSFTDPGGLHRAQSAARGFLRSRLADSDLAAVATFDVNRGVRVVANFTEDRALLVHAVDTLGVPSQTRINDPLGLAAAFENADLQNRGALSAQSTESNTAEIDSVLAILARRLRQADETIYRNQVLSMIGAMEELAKGLRMVEGRKQILYFSAGFDSQTLVGATGSESRQASEAVARGRIWEVDTNARYGDNRLRDVFAAMTRSLSSADCVVHSVDVTGLGSDRSLTQTSVSRDLARDTSGRESLNFMAAETGGRFFKDSNDLSVPLAEITDMTSRFYILGYQPEDLKGPGRFHKLKVKVLRQGTRVSHRTGFHEKPLVSAQTAMQRKFEAAQLVMTGVGQNDLHFSSLCLPFPAEGEKQTLGVVVQIPRSELHWQNGQPVAVELYGYAVGADGQVHDNIAHLARMDPAQADPEGTARGLSFYGTFAVRPGKYTIKLMAREPESGSQGVQFLDVTVPPHDPKVGFLLPPVVMDDAAGWLGLDLRSAGGRPPFPFQIAGKPFLPRATFQVQSGNAERLVLIAFEPSRPGDPASGLEIRSSLADTSGRAVGAGTMKIETVHREAGGRRTYVLGYTPDTLATGDYTLRIGIGESGTRLESYALVRVRPGPVGTPQ